MRRFSRAEAVGYVERFRPFDSAGSYRLEDQELMGESERFVTEVRGEDPATGVLGMPIPLLVRLLQEVALDR
jgi:predicted house-cleaning NTP pyrophosphatase (Maf/HAM1 superfamily)